MRLMEHELPEVFLDDRQLGSQGVRRMRIITTLNPASVTDWLAAQLQRVLAMNEVRKLGKAPSPHFGRLAVSHRLSGKKKHVVVSTDKELENT